MYSEKEIDSILEKREIPKRLGLALFKSRGTFWDILYIDPKVIKNTRKIESK